MRAPEFWAGPPGLLAGLLTPLGAAWLAAGHIRDRTVRPYRAAIPVLCAGNLVAGGAGKTPVVLALAELAANEGVRVHVVTRGYGGRLAGPVQVDPRFHDAAAVGDEPLMIAGQVPCWVARSRADGVREASAAGAELVLLDDGFQNMSVEKDLSLLVVDAEYGFGNGRVIPAGPLREPAADGLARANAVVLIGEGAGPTALRAVCRPVLRADLCPVRGERFAGLRVVAFAGIGRPDKFFASLRAIGAEVLESHPFPDHHRFSERDIAGLRGAAVRSDARLVTTAKDWVRLPAAWRADIDVFEVEIRWREPAAIACLLAPVVSRAVSKRSGGYDRAADRG